VSLANTLFGQPKIEIIPATSDRFRSPAAQQQRSILSDTLPLRKRSERLGVPPRLSQRSNQAPATRQGNPRGTAPIINMEAERQANIIRNEPAIFEIRRNPDANGNAPFRRDHFMGRLAVKRHNSIIVEESRSADFNPDIVRAIMYMENADGNPLGTNRLLEIFGISKTILPMNINPQIWSGLGLTHENASDPRQNIRASVTLLKRISERIRFEPDETTADRVAKIASI
jgi:hypothetical protein